MNITIAPFTVNPTDDCKAPPFGKKEEHVKRDHQPITYWGIYLNDKQIGRASCRERV